MSDEHAAPQGEFVGPEPNSTQTSSFLIQVTNATYFGSGPGTAYVGITTGGLTPGYCYLTSDATAAASFTGWIDGENRKFIATPDGWLSYGGATPYYVGQWKTVSNGYQTWIADGTLEFQGLVSGGVMSFYSDGSNTWLYNQSPGTVGYTPCKVLPATAP
jgi:hypothetical protein